MRRNDPAPDLQALISKHGGYDRIPPEAWAQHDQAMADWQERRRRRGRGGQAGETRPDPEALCTCGSPGVVSRQQKRGKSGGPIWRCEQHRDLWPDYAEESLLQGAAE